MPARHAVSSTLVRKMSFSLGQLKETAVVVEMTFHIICWKFIIILVRFLKIWKGNTRHFIMVLQILFQLVDSKNCFLKWAAALQIDFRTSVDPFCGSSPKKLACDGAHIGISFRQLQFHPIDNLECTHR